MEPRSPYFQSTVLEQLSPVRLQGEGAPAPGPPLAWKKKRALRSARPGSKRGAGEEPPQLGSWHGSAQGDTPLATLGRPSHPSTPRTLPAGVTSPGRAAVENHCRLLSRTAGGRLHLGGSARAQSAESRCPGARLRELCADPSPRASFGLRRLKGADHKSSYNGLIHATTHVSS